MSTLPWYRHRWPWIIMAGPAAVVVVSDGRLDDPPETAAAATLKGLGDALRVPIQTVATTKNEKPDASIRKVGTAGAAVAHVPFPLRIEVGCAGGLDCDELAVTARELKDDGPPSLLASGMVHVKEGKGVLDLTGRGPPPAATRTECCRQEDTGRQRPLHQVTSFGRVGLTFSSRPPGVKGPDGELLRDRLGGWTS